MALVGCIALLPAPIFKLIVLAISGVIILLASELASVRKYNDDLCIRVIGLVALVGFIAILPPPIFKLIVIVISGVIILLALSLSSVR